MSIQIKLPNLNSKEAKKDADKSSKSTVTDNFLSSVESLIRDFFQLESEETCQFMFYRLVDNLVTAFSHCPESAALRSCLKTVVEYAPFNSNSQSIYSLAVIKILIDFVDTDKSVMIEKMKLLLKNHKLDEQSSDFLNSVVDILSDIFSNFNKHTTLIFSCNWTKTRPE